MTNKMMYVASKLDRSNNHKKYLKHFYDVTLCKTGLFCPKTDKLFSSKKFIDDNIVNDNASLKYIETSKLKITKKYIDLYGHITDSNNNAMCNLPIGRYVFKNLRMCVGFPVTLMNSCSLVIGGNIIDKIDKNMFDVLCHLYDINDRTIIPLFFCNKNKYLYNTSHQQIRIEFNMSKDYEIDDVNNLVVEIDVYEIDFNNETLYNRNQFFITQNSAQYDVIKIHVSEIEYPKNTEDLFMNTKLLLCDGVYDFYKLSCVKLCTHIILEFSNSVKIDNINLLFYVNINHTNKFFIYSIQIGHMYYIADNKIIIPLTKSFNYEDISKYFINFHCSRCHYLCIESSKDYQLINIYSIDINILRHDSGYSCVVFSP
jgi:hypothetical protein